MSRGRITRGRWGCATGSGAVAASALVDSNLPNSSVGNSTFSEGRSSMGIKSSSASISERIELSSSTTAGLGLRIGLLMGRFSVSGWAAGFSSCADGTVSGFSVVSSAGLASVST